MRCLIAERGGRVALGLYFSWRGSAEPPLGKPTVSMEPMGRHDDDDLPKLEAFGIIFALSTGVLPPRPDILYCSALYTIHTLPHSAPCCIDLCKPGPGLLSSQIRFFRSPRHSQPLNISLHILYPSHNGKSLGRRDRIRVHGRAYVPCVSSLGTANRKGKEDDEEVPPAHPLYC